MTYHTMIKRIIKYFLDDMNKYISIRISIKSFGILYSLPVDYQKRLI